MTTFGDEPQEEKNAGDVVRLTLLVLALALRTRLDAPGLHVNESARPPVPAAPEKVSVTGLVAHVALGWLEAEKPTAE